MPRSGDTRKGAATKFNPRDDVGRVEIRFSRGNGPEFDPPAGVQATGGGSPDGANAGGRVQSCRPSGGADNRGTPGAQGESDLFGGPGNFQVRDLGLVIKIVYKFSQNTLDFSHLQKNKLTFLNIFRGIALEFVVKVTHVHCGL